MRNIAFWAIFCIPVLWGIGFPLTHNAVQSINPGVFSFYRQLIAALSLLPFAIKFLPQINKRLIIGAFMIGIWNTLNMTCQCFALSTISSAMTAFFVTLNILFIPIVLLLFRLSRVKIIDIFVVFIGLLSIFITFHGSLSGFQKGDVFGLGAAFAIAMNIITIQIITKNNNVNRLLLAFLSMVFGVLLLSLFPLTIEAHPFATPKIWGALIYQGCISTALAYLLQITFQKQVGETRVGVILNLDLVFASLFGLLNGEPLTFYQILGGIVAFIASIIHDVVPAVKKIIFGFFSYSEKTKKVEV